MTPRDTARQLRANPTPETIRTAADTLDAFAKWLDVVEYADNLPNRNQSGGFLSAWIAQEAWALRDYEAHKAARGVALA
ncbi:hypothetical protein [Roseomonas sp. BN140053]|uniref:hypothetical protein n=1 Tax=Roseomonas sp. BN140053 TaxID=3391898 RepID=UPI0039ED9996